MTKKLQSLEVAEKLRELTNSYIALWLAPDLLKRLISIRMSEHCGVSENDAINNLYEMADQLDGEELEKQFSQKVTKGEKQ